MKNLAWGDRWCEHAAMEKTGWGMGWWKKSVMRILCESWGDGNDLPCVHKALGEWLASVGIWEGVLALFPSRMLAPGNTMLRILFLPTLTSGRRMTENWILRKNLRMTQITKCYRYNFWNKICITKGNDTYIEVYYLLDTANQMTNPDTEKL